MPDCELTQTIRASSFSTWVSSRAWVMSSCACRFTAMTEFHRAASMLTSSLSRVIPAVLTTTARAPRREAPPAHPVGARGQLVAGCRDVDGDHVRAVPGHDAGDRGADAAGRTGDDGDLARQRLLVILPAGNLGDRQRDHLTVDVGRSAGQE